MLLIRRPGGPWREPATTSYANEKELQDLVKASATLLPDTAPSAVVDEFWIPEAGSVDLLVVDRSGALTLVECKLRANPEIRREVVGQILAYAFLFGIAQQAVTRLVDRQAQYIITKVPSKEPTSDKPQPSLDEQQA